MALRERLGIWLGVSVYTKRGGSNELLDKLDNPAPLAELHHHANDGKAETSGRHVPGSAGSPFGCLIVGSLSSPSAFRFYLLVRVSLDIFGDTWGFCRGGRVVEWWVRGGEYFRRLLQEIVQGEVGDIVILAPDMQPFGMFQPSARGSELFRDRRILFLSGKSISTAVVRETEMILSRPVGSIHSVGAGRSRHCSDLASEWCAEAACKRCKSKGQSSEDLSSSRA